MIKIGHSCTCYGTIIHGLHFNLHGFRRLPILLYSTSSTKKGNNNRTIVNFLVDSLGFSKHQSLSTSSKLLKSRNRRGGERRVTDCQIVENAACVVHFFKQLGFELSDIRKVVVCGPNLLGSKVETTLKPKIKLLLDLGFSGSHLVLAITKNPLMLNYELGPAIHAFKTVLGSDENVVVMLRQNKRIYFCKAANYLIPNVELLQNLYGIPGDKIQKFIIRDPNPFTVRTDLFRDKLIRVEQYWGIPSNSAMFLYGLSVARLTEKSVEDKCQIFKNFGWTQSDVIALIRKNPTCLTSSEASIGERLDFLMNQLDYKPNYLALQPLLFTCSIKNRLLPRHRVLQVLKEKGLLRMDYSLVTAATFSEPRFLKKFVLPFEEVYQVYAQLTGSTVESLTVGKQEG